jgi:hypothetical protein
MQGGKTMNGCRTYLRKLSQPLGTQRIQYPRRQISSIKPEKKKKKSGKEVRVYAREISQGKLLTSWGEAEDSWASRETSGSFAFFTRLGFRGTGTFFTEALVTLGATT